MVKFAMMSDQGSRENNEDSVGMYQDEVAYCFALADGLGGHGKGEVASRLAVDSVILRFSEGNRGEEFLGQAFESAQSAIMAGQEKSRECRDMKTTLVVLEVGEEKVQWAHMGDSRLYFFQNGKIRCRTMDHSVPQMLASVGEIKERDIRHHPDRNRLLRVLGVEMDEVNCTMSEPVAREGRQAFLLCSDGFWELIEERKMEAAYRRSRTPDEWLGEMAQIVQKNGQGTNMDNFSAIAVWLEN